MVVVFDVSSPSSVITECGSDPAIVLHFPITDDPHIDDCRSGRSEQEGTGEERRQPIGRREDLSHNRLAYRGEEKADNQCRGRRHEIEVQSGRISSIEYLVKGVCILVMEEDKFAREFFQKNSMLSSWVRVESDKIAKISGFNLSLCMQSSFSS